MNDLTNDQKYILTSMYKYFLELQPALSPDKANLFSNSDFIQEKFAPHFSKDYVSDICWKLCRKGYISCYPGDNLANSISLEDKTIIYMENSFKRNISSIVSFMEKLISIVKP